MTKSELIKYYTELKNKILYHNKKYYVDNTPEITDEQYDKLYKKLNEMEQKFPFLITEDSPTKQVGAPVKKAEVSKQKAKHEKPMLSLGNTYSEQDLMNFYNSNLKNLNKNEDDLTYVVEPKFDGISIELIYENGKLDKAITRGDGITGELITEKVRQIANVPKELQNKQLVPKTLTVRGEIFMTFADFNALNAERQKTNEPLFMNPRNAVGGTLNLKDVTIVKSRNLRCAVYHSDYTIKNSHLQTLSYLKQLGFPVYKYNLAFSFSKDSVKDLITKWAKFKTTLDFPIDGLVFKLENIEDRHTLGTTAKEPRWAIAYKFPSEQVATLLKAVTYQLGRTGVITPVAELEPVIISGSKIRRATLHNFDYVQQLDLHIGDTVLVEKAGEIIPQVLQVVKQGTPRQEISIPTECPVCKSSVYRKIIENTNEYEKAYRCSNVICPGIMEQKLIHFVGRDMMNIDTLGEKVVSLLYKKQKIKTYSDIYKLSPYDLYDIEGMGDKKVENIINAIENSKTPEFGKFIFALGIPQVGKTIAKKLAQYLENFEYMLVLEQQLKSKETMQVELEQLEFGPVVAKNVIDFLYNETVQNELCALYDVGIRPKTEDRPVTGGILSGMIFVITGELSRQREFVKKEIEDNGGKVTSAVSKKTTYLLLGDNPGSKYQKAQELGIKIINEMDLYNILQANNEN